MKKQIVLWGKDAEDKDILITLRLRVQDKKIDLWTFKKDKLEEEFVEQMFSDWQEIDTTKFPENHVYLEREVSSSELLPSEIKTTQTDLIIRAEKEWYFQVLAYQMFEQLKADINAFGEQVNGLQEFSQDVWDEAKAYSDKVKQHAIEKTLLRSQVTELRKLLDTSFGKLKELLATGGAEFEKEASENFEKIKVSIDNFKNRIADNPNVKQLFEELKKYQLEIKDVKLKASQRKDVWALMNETFNALKELRKNSAANRLEARVAGLEKAMNKMAGSINRDEKDLQFQKKRIENTGSKLEAQLREAKIQMLEATISSKQAKFDDMKKTMDELQKSLADIQAKMQKPLSNELVAEGQGNLNQTNESKAVTTDVEVSSSIADENKVEEKISTESQEAENDDTETKIEEVVITASNDVSIEKEEEIKS